MTRFKEVTGYALERKTILCNEGREAETGTAVRLNNGSIFIDQSQTATTVVYPVSGLHAGDIINAFRITGAIGATGSNATTVDADLRKITKGAGALTDASIGAITQVSVTADTALDSAKASLDEVVATDYQYYVLVTVTTAANAANDAFIAGVEVDLNNNI